MKLSDLIFSPIEEMKSCPFCDRAYEINMSGWGTIFSKSCVTQYRCEVMQNGGSLAFGCNTLFCPQSLSLNKGKILLYYNEKRFIFPRDSKANLKHLLLLL